MFVGGQLYVGGLVFISTWGKWCVCASVYVCVRPCAYACAISMYNVFCEYGKHVCLILQYTSLFLLVAYFMCLPTHSVYWYMH